MKWSPALPLLLCAVTASPGALAKGTWNFKIENDWAFASDGNYTSGLFLGWTAAPESTDFDPQLWSATLGRLTPGASDQPSRKTWGWKVGQKMWTPSSIKQPEPLPDERPYAGLLFLETSLYDISDTSASRWSLMIGQVGPSSYAETVQRETHRWFPASDPQGWDYQVQDQLVFQLSLDRNTLISRQPLLPGNELEWSAQGRLAAGNYQSEGRLGTVLRWGTDLASSYGTVGLAPGYQPTMLLPDSGRGYYLYAGIEGRYRFNDVTLEGKTPAEVPTVDLAHLQATGALGIVWYSGSWGATWRFVIDSRDFEQDASAYHGYGGLEFFWRF